jgi:hypothetical protein
MAVSYTPKQGRYLALWCVFVLLLQKTLPPDATRRLPRSLSVDLRFSLCGNDQSVSLMNAKTLLLFIGMMSCFCLGS